MIYHDLHYYLMNIVRAAWTVRDKVRDAIMSSGGSCRRPGSNPGEGPDMLNRPSVRPSVRTMENGDEKK